MTRLHVCSLLVRRTSTLRARLCFRTLTSASWTIRANSSAVGAGAKWDRRSHTKSRRDTRIAAEAVDQRGEHVGKLIARFELDRPQRLHQFPQREDLALQQLLNVAQLRVHRRLDVSAVAAPQRLDLHLDSK